MASANNQGELFSVGVGQGDVSAYKPQEYVRTPQTDYSGVSNSVGNLLSVAGAFMGANKKDKKVENISLLEGRINDDVSAIRSAREQGKISDTRASAMLNKKYEDLVRDNPAYGEEIRKIYSGILGLSSISNVFNPTPEEKGKEEAEQSNAKDMALVGLNYDDEYQRDVFIHNKRLAKELKDKVDFNKDQKEFNTQSFNETAGKLLNSSLAMSYSEIGNLVKAGASQKEIQAAIIKQQTMLRGSLSDFIAVNNGNLDIDAVNSLTENVGKLIDGLSSSAGMSATQLDNLSKINYTVAANEILANMSPADRTQFMAVVNLMNSSGNAIGSATANNILNKATLQYAKNASENISTIKTVTNSKGTETSNWESIGRKSGFELKDKEATEFALNYLSKDVEKDSDDFYNQNAMLTSVVGEISSKISTGEDLTKEEISFLSDKRFGDLILKGNKIPEKTVTILNNYVRNSLIVPALDKIRDFNNTNLNSIIRGVNAESLPASEKYISTPYGSPPSLVELAKAPKEGDKYASDFVRFEITKDGYYYAVRSDELTKMLTSPDPAVREAASRADKASYAVAQKISQQINKIKDVFTNLSKYGTNGNNVDHTASWIALMSGTGNRDVESVIPQPEGTSNTANVETTVNTKKDLPEVKESNVGNKVELTNENKTPVNSGLDLEDYLSSIKKIESGKVEDGSDPSINQRGYKGLYQIGESYLKEFNKKNNTNYTLEEMKDNDKAKEVVSKQTQSDISSLKKSDIDINKTNLYLVHQQGMTGLKKIIKAFSGESLGKTVRSNILNNLPKSLKEYAKTLGDKGLAEFFYEHYKHKLGE